MQMKPGKNKNEWGGSEWEEKTPEECKREHGLAELINNVSAWSPSPKHYILSVPAAQFYLQSSCVLVLVLALELYNTDR